MTFKILIPDPLDHDAVQMLVDAGFDVVAPGKMARGETISAVADVDAMIIRSGTTADAELIEAAENLKVIVRAGVGVDNIDKPAATKAGIVAMNTPGSNTISTAEQAFSLMTACFRHLPQAHNSLAEGRWDRKKYVGTELRGKTLGIIGCGRVGTALAKRAAAFEMEVVGYDPFVSEIILSDNVKIPTVDLDEVLRASDVISFHVGLTDQTRGMIDEETIKRMKDGVVLINTSRGAVFNMADVASGLDAEKISAVGIDVYEVEPPPAEHPLIGRADVVHTPHLGASTRDAQKAVGFDAAAQVIAALSKSEYQYVVNPDVLDK